MFKPFSVIKTFNLSEVGVSSESDRLEKLYKEKIFISNGRCSAEELLAICQEILQGDVSLEVKAATYVVSVYKNIELSNEVVASKVMGDKLLESLELASFSIVDNSRLGVREDPVQLYISVLTAQWHLMVYLKESPLPYLERMFEFSNLIKTIKPSYTQNIGNAALLLAYCFFEMGAIAKCKSIIFGAYGFFLRAVCSQGSGNMPTSSHFGDIMKMGRAVQSLLAGNEWILGHRKREALWSKNKVIRYASRVDVDGCEVFLKNFSDFIDSLSVKN